MKPWRRDLLVLVAAVAVGALVERATFRAACAVEAWLAAADLSHEWWRLQHVDGVDLDAEEGA